MHELYQGPAEHMREEAHCILGMSWYAAVHAHEMLVYDQEDDRTTRRHESFRRELLSIKQARDMHLPHASE